MTAAVEAEVEDIVGEIDDIIDEIVDNCDDDCGDEDFDRVLAGLDASIDAVDMDDVDLATASREELSHALDDVEAFLMRSLCDDVDVAG